jgi:hypothetical protein
MVHFTGGLTAICTVGRCLSLKCGNSDSVLSRVFMLSGGNSNMGLLVADHTLSHNTLYSAMVGSSTLIRTNTAV